MRRKSHDQYSEREARQRFEAALRGSRLATHTPMKDMPRKRPKKPRKQQVKTAVSAAT
jgi:hypothetical protein